MQSTKSEYKSEYFNRPTSCWVITNGQAGFISQAFGLAEALNLPTEAKIFKRKLPFSLIPPMIFPGSVKFITPDSDMLSPPWPDVLIACGTQTIPFALHIKKQSGGRTFSIYIQNPKVYSKYFDVVIPMSHDNIKGANILEADMALNKVTPARIFAEQERFSEFFAKMAKPIYSVIIGGSTKKYSMTKHTCQDLLTKIRSIKSQLFSGSLLISLSRRTPRMMLEFLHDSFAHDDSIYIIKPDSSHNPYYAMLGFSEKIFVTNDSVSMLSEACAAGKQVYIIPLLGFTAGKPKLFSDNLLAKKFVTLFEGGAIKESHTISYNETERIAKLVEDKLCLNYQK